MYALCVIYLIKHLIFISLNIVSLIFNVFILFSFSALFCKEDMSLAADLALVCYVYSSKGLFVYILFIIYIVAP